MLAIIYDLEMTVKRKKGEFAEIIEIGAVKVAEQDGKAAIADTFQAFVKPTLSPKLSQDTVNFTGIRQEDVNGSPVLQDVLDQFVAWIDTEDYALCSWGPDDKAQFLKECRMKRIPLHWLRNHNNLQKPVSKIMNRSSHQQVGLKTALDTLQVPFVGTQHRALDDAYNTALIYIHMIDRIQLQQNEVHKHPSYESAVVYRDEAEDDTDNNPFAALARLQLPKE
ncbi:exonuclease domain-containing protein [Paenibacillus popilliae]|uniref:Inhibitor of the KinA pathway to sporulation n=1 Tax=Paenibacillus popilliae ATCC 14706 TaxID=1212764 RepID=M9LAP9_PAEPP|nr:exonuclease domain-containing protein [Paenibacillus popilliae]GAC42757.1 inhibitor of the KinA pathway to sporulation [Paenibacillus popilliae ATCC 14706]